MSSFITASGFKKGLPAVALPHGTSRGIGGPRVELPAAPTLTKGRQPLAPKVATTWPGRPRRPARPGPGPPSASTKGPPGPPAIVARRPPARAYSVAEAVIDLIVRQVIWVQELVQLLPHRIAGI